MGSNVFGRGIRNEKILSFFIILNGGKELFSQKSSFSHIIPPLTLIGFSSMSPNFLLYREKAH